VHVTGGGIGGNLVRVCRATSTPGCAGRLARARIFAEVAAAGSVDPSEMERVFNLGLGMLAVVPGGRDAEEAVEVVSAHGLGAWAVGEITDGAGRAVVDRG